MRYPSSQTTGRMALSLLFSFCASTHLVVRARGAATPPVDGLGGKVVVVGRGEIHGCQRINHKEMAVVPVALGLELRVFTRGKGAL